MIGRLGLGGTRSRVSSVSCSELVSLQLDSRPTVKFKQVTGLVLNTQPVSRKPFGVEGIVILIGLDTLLRSGPGRIWISIVTKKKDFF